MRQPLKARKTTAGALLNSGQSCKSWTMSDKLRVTRSWSGAMKWTRI